MGADRATRAVLRDLADETSLTRGHDDIDVVRADYDRVFSSWTAGAAAPTREEWIDIDTEAGRTNALIVEPLNEAAGTVLFFHGGGWSLGSALCYAPLCRALAAESGMRVIAPDFPQAPERPFPAAFDLLAAATIWADETFDGPLFLSGDSAGGTLAAAIGQSRRDAPPTKGQALFYPVLDLRPDARYPSRRRFGTGKFFLSEDGILGAAAWYCGDATSPEDPRVSPILEPDPKGAPPTFLLLPGLDPLKDEGEKYAARLKKHGVPVDVYHAKNTIHGCVSFSGRIPQGREGIKRAVQFFRRHV